MSDSAGEFFFYFSKKLGWSSDGMQKKIYWDGLSTGIKLQQYMCVVESR